MKVLSSIKYRVNEFLNNPLKYLPRGSYIFILMGALIMAAIVQ